MIQIDLLHLVSLMGIPTAITGLFFFLIERRITNRHKKMEAQEKAREELEIIVIQGNGAAIALAEATARAVQRIPDAHCNGDMRAALEYATKTKHAQKDFLTKQGVQALFE